MTHKPIRLHDISFVLPHRACFADFSALINHGQRIGVIGQNGSGKSTLIKMLSKTLALTQGEIFIPIDVHIGYVPQMVLDYACLSGAERFNRALSQALMSSPNLLLLDEPTNHLDKTNRTSLKRMLKSFPHTLIIATHDVDILRSVIEIIWHIDDGKIEVFKGGFDDYMRELTTKRRTIVNEIEELNGLKLEAHKALMKEQARAKNSRLVGEKNIEKRKWPTIVSSAKARRAEETSGRKKSHLREAKNDLSKRLAKLRLPEVITPKFQLKTPPRGRSMLISIKNGIVGYSSNLLTDINWSVFYGDRIAITGDNGSGKSTLIKALLNEKGIKKAGEWVLPSKMDTGYLDQHYQNLDASKTVFQTIGEARPTCQQSEVRLHLNDFLFRKNEEVNSLVKTLSGGEKARLSLAKIAALSPKLLLLDEITNNVDLTTREHLIQVLTQFKGALVVISHDEDFLKALGIRDVWMVEGGKLLPCGVDCHS